MKILTKSKRSTVRFLVKRAVADLNTAIGISLKAYGSSELHHNLRLAVKDCEDAISALNKTRLPVNNSAASELPSQYRSEEQENPPSKAQETENETQAAERPVVETNTEKRFRDIVCNHLGITPEQCKPQSILTDDLGADDLDEIEIAIKLEDEFGITITDEELASNQTYKELLNLVKDKVPSTASHAEQPPELPF